MLLCLYENSPLLSAPVNAWNTGKAFALSAHMALHIGSIFTSPETIEIDVFFRMRSQFAMTNTKTVRHLCLGRRKPFVHSVGFTVMPGQRGRSTVRVLPRDYILSWTGKTPLPLVCPEKQAMTRLCAVL